MRPQSLQRPNLPTPPTTTTTQQPTTTASTTHRTETISISTTTECPPNATSGPAADTVRPANSQNLLRKLASSHYQSYTTALTVTIAVGCFLLLLNILIFAGIYHQRDRASTDKKKKKKEELAEVNSCSSSSGDIETKQALPESNSGGCSTIVELPLQEFKSSPPSGAKRMLNCTSNLPPGYCMDPQESSDTLTSPSIPEPPPPPKAQPPLMCNTGILRQQGCPQTPSQMKKRVQIQEISV